MNFVAPRSIESARQYLESCASTNRFLADTEIQLVPEVNDSIRFRVRRVWKGRMGIRYCAIEAVGILKADGDKQTDVNVGIQIRPMAFVVISLAIIIVVFALTVPVYKGFGPGVFALMGMMIFAFLAYDWYVLRRIIHQLR